MLERSESYDALAASFEWPRPQRFNIGVAVCDRWAARDGDRVALFDYREEGAPERLTFAALKAHSDALASALTGRGVRAGDRVAILLPQAFETVIAHVAAYKMGAIALPLSILFGAEALEYRLAASNARAIVSNEAGLARLRPVLGRLPGLQTVVLTEGPQRGALGFWDLVADHQGPFEAVETLPDDPAMMIFTSGTTGAPKAALHGHRVLIGHLPGVEMPHEFFPRPGDLFWTPADWAWAGGLLNALLPSLYFGVPVVASRSEGFEAEAALGLMEKMGVRNAFIPPTALRMMKSAERIGERFKLSLRTIASAGEPLGRETYEWAQSALGLTVNESYGQTECNLVLASSTAMGVSRAGAIGKPVPGHEVAVIDEEGRTLPIDTRGQIAVRRPDPAMFLEYWRDPEATAAKFLGDWMLTGDLGAVDEDGYFHFFGRDDDIITSSGYRIGPSEVEDCLAGHRAVALAAVVGKPDVLRTEIVKAYVVLKDGFEPAPALAEEITQWVREKLSAHEYPREVEFVESVPLTATGKVIRRTLRERAREEASGEGGA